MTSIIIKNGSKEIYTAPVTKDVREVRKLGGDHYIELPIDTDTVQPFTKGCTIEAGVDSYNAPMVWTLKRNAVPEPIQGVNGYRYVLRFYAAEHLLEDILFKLKNDPFPGRPFRITTSLKQFCSLIVNCMGTTSYWRTDSDLDNNDMREISFEGENCREAAAKVAEAFGVEWWVEYRSNYFLRFGKCENGEEKTIKEGEIVNRFPASKRGDDSNYGTRFYIYGGTTNVPADYRSDEIDTPQSSLSGRRICLRDFGDLQFLPVNSTLDEPEYVKYYDAVSGITKRQIIEKLIILDDIYPKKTYSVSSVSTKKKDIGLENEVDIYTINFTDSVRRDNIEGNVSLTFTSGTLNGRSFNVNLIPRSVSEAIPNYSDAEIIPIIEELPGSSRIITPGALRPSKGDTFILSGVKCRGLISPKDPTDPVVKAEFELWQKGRELADKYAADTNIYDCETNPVYCAANEIKFDIGQKVVLKGAHFGEKGRKSRVQGYERKLYNPYIATYSIGDNTVYSRSLRMSKLINMTARATEQSTTILRNNFFQTNIGFNPIPLKPITESATAE